jgi:hypothetical protein
LETQNWKDLEKGKLGTLMREGILGNLSHGDHVDFDSAGNSCGNFLSACRYLVERLLMLINIFAIDPGTTTGWAYAKGAETRGIPAELDLAVGQISGEEYQQSYDLSRLIERCWPCAVIIEDFIPRQLNKERWFLSPVRVTNQLGMLLWLKDRQWLLQQPSLAKSTINDETLKRFDLYSKGQPHANDATRHLLTYLKRVNQKPQMYADLIEPRGLNTMTPNTI